MPINIAMPVAHETTAANYISYYQPDASFIAVRGYFNRNGCQGICLQVNTGVTPAIAPDEIWNLYAFADGFLSFRTNDTLVLRLPRELNAAAVNAHNSGRQFMALTPQGPQLRHVTYVFNAAPGSAVEDRVRDVVNDATHPGRGITRVINPAGGTQTLGAYIAAAPANANNVVQDFMNGNVDLFVRAGDTIGNFRDFQIDIRFLDSCGTPNPAAANVGPVVPKGKPTNPSYFLYLVRVAANVANVNMLTAFAAAPAALTDFHPLDHLFSQPVVTAAGGNLDQVLDLAAGHPPRPLHVTVEVRDAVGNPIATRGIPIAALGEWHESRNAPNPYNTNSPVRWRNYGNQPGDGILADRTKFRTRMKAGQQNRLPGGAAFDHNHAPVPLHQNLVRTYWERYGEMFNAVAGAFELPCDLLVAIACKETAAGGWYNGGNFAVSHEMDVIRMEPLNAQPANITADPASQALLNNYLNLAGGTVPGAPHSNGANANMPVPWSGAGQVNAANPLTWAQLRQLINDFPPNVRVSPGVMQTLVSTAHGDMGWIDDIYGGAYIHSIDVMHNGILLTADDPPNQLGNLFVDWFGVAVDAAGNNTNVAADIDAILTKMKRALHNIIAGCAHLKRTYNTVRTTGAGNRFNLICDFDLPSLASGYNDGANAVPAAAPGASIDTKWNRLFALRFYGAGYPQSAPKLYNAAVDLFNAMPAGQPMPELRLWRD